MTPKRTVRIKFMDFWPGFEQRMEANLIMRVLRKHYNVVITDDADYVFFAPFGESHWGVPDRCIKIFHTGEDVVPDFNACDYGIGFEWMDYEDRYLRMPNYYFWEREQLDRLEHKHELPAGWSLSSDKPDFCSFVVSNPLNPLREEMMTKLSDYKRINSGGGI